MFSVSEIVFKYEKLFFVFAVSKKNKMEWFFYISVLFLRYLVCITFGSIYCKCASFLEHGYPVTRRVVPDVGNVYSMRRKCVQCKALPYIPT